MWTCKGKNVWLFCLGYWMENARYSVQYDGDCNIWGTDWSVGFSHLFKTYLNTGLLVK